MPIRVEYGPQAGLAGQVALQAGWGLGAAQRQQREQAAVEAQAQRDMQQYLAQLAEQGAMGRAQLGERGAMLRGLVGEEAAMGRAQLGERGALLRGLVSEQGAMGRAQMALEEAGMLERGRMERFWPSLEAETYAQQQRVGLGMYTAQLGEQGALTRALMGEYGATGRAVMGLEETAMRERGAWARQQEALEAQMQLGEAGLENQRYLAGLQQQGLVSREQAAQLGATQRQALGAAETQIRERARTYRDLLGMAGDEALARAKWEWDNPAFGSEDYDRQMAAVGLAGQRAYVEKYQGAVGAGQAELEQTQAEMNRQHAAVDQVQRSGQFTYEQAAQAHLQIETDFQPQIERLMQQQAPFDPAAMGRIGGSVERLTEDGSMLYLNQPGVVPGLAFRDPQTGGYRYQQLTPVEDRAATERAAQAAAQLQQLKMQSEQNKIRGQLWDYALKRWPKPEDTAAAANWFNDEWAKVTGAGGAGPEMSQAAGAAELMPFGMPTGAGAGAGMERALAINDLRIMARGGPNISADEQARAAAWLNSYGKSP